MKISRSSFFITFLLCLLLQVQAATVRTDEQKDQHIKDLYEQRAYSSTRNSMTILMNILNASLKTDELAESKPVLEGADLAELEGRPVVKKFAGDIYAGEYFTESVYNDYFKAFFDGYSMLTYQYAQECQDDLGTFMDFFHEFHLNMTRRKTGDGVLEDWFDPYRLIADTLGNSFNKFWFNCFQFGFDVYDSYKIKFDNFVDFGDIYLSFIFNMLSQSINIKTEVEAMISAFAIHDTEEFVRGLASILKSVLDFNSYQTASGSIDNPIELAFVKSVREPNKQQRANMRANRMREAERKLAAKKEADRTQAYQRYSKAVGNGAHPLVAL